MTQILLNFRLEQIVALAAKLVTIEEFCGQTLDELENMTGLPLREATDRVKDRKSP